MRIIQLFTILLLLSSCDTKMQSEHTFKIEPLMVQLTNENWGKLHPTWSVDGSKIAFTSSGVKALYRQYSITSNFSSLFAFFLDGYNSSSSLSPDGTNLAYNSGSRGYIWIHSLVDGTESMLTSQHKRASSPAWSPTGTKLAYKVLNEIWIISSDGGLNEKVLEIDNGSIHTISWSPDEKELVFDYYVVSQSFTGWDIGIVSLENGEIRPLVDDKKNGKNNPAWSVDGTKIMYISDLSDSSSIYMVSPKGDKPYKFIENLKGIFRPRWSSDGSMIACKTINTSEIYIFSSDGKMLKNIIPGTDYAGYYYFWNHTGDGIIVPKNVNNANVCTIFFIDKKIIPLTTGEGDTGDNFPAWFPDSNKLLFIRDYELWVVSSLGDETKLFHNDYPSEKYNPDISKDGTKIAYDNGSDIFIISTEGGDIVNVTKDINDPLNKPAWSPDGKQIVCQFKYGIKIFTIIKDKLKEDIVIGGDFSNPCWSVNNKEFGSHIAVASSAGIYVISPQDWKPELMISTGQFPCWSPDGTKLAYVKNNDIYVTRVFQELEDGH